MRAAVHAEWTKLRTVASPRWLLLGTVTATVALGVAVTSVVPCAAAGCAGGPTGLSLTGVRLGQATVVVLAVLMVSGEYGSGMIRTSLAAMPRRVTVLAAKSVVLAGVVAAAGTVAVLGALLGGRLVLGVPAGAWPVPATVGSILYLTLVALFGLGVATVVRDSATSIGIVLGLLYLVPILSTALGGPRWLHRLGPGAGLAVTDPRLGPWSGLGVLTAWTTAALLTGALLLCRRDA